MHPPPSSPTPLAEKSTLEEIRTRFDHDVERFSKLETGQQATVDAPLVLELIAKVAGSHLQTGSSLLDLGCGAGNMTLRIMQETGPLHCHLVDLSQAMLTRALDRAAAADAASVHPTQTDLRTLEFEASQFDAVVAGAVLHHLRDDADWENVFRQIRRWLKPGGRLYVADLITFDDPTIQKIMWDRYGDYLTGLGGPDYRDKVFAYIDKEDTPRSLPYQLNLCREVGFRSWEVLHRNSVFACYVAEG
ncbi:class I SAM-dependent methyltransferase [Verrucomicrobium sp. BvORR034]|uniref:class I SAM-dependent methyltransferase n=1 Tax=Verrucomicrobium sp. BvORR034 TaxID=1396418 RepID=UPI000678A202|nr:class I SAM-dependent methyltransferase [Verrucomicrobium sp. BvORR034]